jgi:hypothetical protein
LIYNGNESVAYQAANDTIDADENQDATTVGLRADRSWSGGSGDALKAGFDVEKSTANEDFLINLPPPSSPLTDDGTPHEWNTGIYAEDNWSRGRFAVSCGLRFDQNSEDVTKNQLSPRVNVKYRLDRHDTVHAYYDRLFQPISVEDAVRLVGNQQVGDNGVYSPLLPERDDYYEIGIDRTIPGLSLGAVAYYKFGHDVRDDDQVGNTNVMLPVNDSKAYFDGFEFTSSRDFSTAWHGFANIALSWNKNAGPVTGGLNEGGFPSAYFYDDHDQTYTSTFGFSYNRRGAFADIAGQYGSGQPYGQINDAAGNAIDLNYLRVPPHITFDLECGKTFVGGFGASVFVDNVFNDAYVIKQVTGLSDAQFAEGRIYGIRTSLDF